MCVTALALSACNARLPSSTQAPAQPGAPQDRSLAGTSCGDLAKLNLPNTTITAAEDVAAGAFAPPNDRFYPPAPPGAPTPYGRLPPFCRVAGTIAPVPGVRDPFRSVVAQDLERQVRRHRQRRHRRLHLLSRHGGAFDRGYAVAATDTGHSGGHGGLELCRSSREVDRLRLPRHSRDDSEVQGCCRGALRKRQRIVRTGTDARRAAAKASSTAHRFPEDYDGIIARAPAINLTHAVFAECSSAGDDGLGSSR